MICFSFLEQVFGDFTFQRNFCYVEKGQNLCVCVVFPVPRAAGDRLTLSCDGSRKMLPRAELQQRSAPRKDIFLLPLTGQCILTATLLEEMAASLVLTAVAASDFQVDLVRKLCSYHTALPRIMFA